MSLLQIPIFDYWIFFLDLIFGRRQQVELQIASQRERDTVPYLGSTAPLRVLDLGNGRLRPQYEILRRQGHQVDGIDRENGPCKANFKDIAYVFARFLFSLSMSGNANRASKLHKGDVVHLPFPSNTFDLVSSIAAFEHFLDVPRVLDEVQRVLKPGGILWCGIHLFTSLSGGHNVGLRLETLDHMPAGIEPWDHLRKRRIPFTVPLNELRLKDYIMLVEERFEILNHYGSGKEGVEILKILGHLPELQQYTHEELTTRGYIIVAKKR